MTKTDQERQMVRSNKEREDRNLSARIRECEERTKIKEMLDRKWAEMSRLLAEQRANAEKLSVAFLNLKEANKR